MRGVNVEKEQCVTAATALVHGGARSHPRLGCAINQTFQLFPTRLQILCVQLYVCETCDSYVTLQVRDLQFRFLTVKRSLACVEEIADILIVDFNLSR